MAGFNVIAVDWRHEYTNGKIKKPPNFFLADIVDYPPEELYFRVFIKTSKINDKTERDSGLSKGFLIRSSHPWKKKPGSRHTVMIRLEA